MADGTTPNYALVLIEVGGSRDNWGEKLNANSSAIDVALKALSDAVGGKLASASYTASDVLAKITTALGSAPVKKAGDAMTGPLTVAGTVDAVTPGTGSTGGVRVRASGAGKAIFQGVTADGAGELGHMDFDGDSVDFFGPGATLLASLLRTGNVGLLVKGIVDAVSPGSGSTGGIRLRASQGFGNAIIQIVTNDGGAEIARLDFNGGNMDVYLGNVRQLRLASDGNLLIRGSLVQNYNG